MVESWKYPQHLRIIRHFLLALDAINIGNPEKTFILRICLPPDIYIEDNTLLKLNGTRAYSGSTQWT